MTLTLSPEMEARVHKVAKMLRHTPVEAVLEMLNQALCQYEYARYEIGEEEAQEIIVALQQSADDFAAGRSILLEEFEAQVQERRRTRRIDGVKDTL